MRRVPGRILPFRVLRGRAAVAGPLAGASRGAGLHLFVALAPELLVEDAG